MVLTNIFHSSFYLKSAAAFRAAVYIFIRLFPHLLFVYLIMAFLLGN